MTAVTPTRLALLRAIEAGTVYESVRDNGHKARKWSLPNLNYAHESTQRWIVVNGLAEVQSSRDSRRAVVVLTDAGRALLAEATDA